MRTATLGLLLVLAIWSSRAADTGARHGGPLAGAESHPDLRYLPDDRYTGDDGPRKDHQLKLNLYVPPEGERCPVIFVVHGGAYSAGDKDTAKSGPIYESFCKGAIARGYATAGLNYVLRPKDIFPQVFYDTQDAIRFLRLHAAKYRLDPTRFGAVGFSAGGWLISTIGFAHGDIVLTGMSGGIPIMDLASGRRGKPWDASRLPAFRERDSGFVHPAWSPAPAWPDQYGQLQAISYDFSHFRNCAHAAAPAVNRWVGEDCTPPEVAEFKAVGVEYDLSVLTGDRYRGKGVHVPNMESPCRSAKGGAEVTLEERILQFFDDQFGPKARTPAPEIRPGLRVFKGEVTVSMLAPDPAIAIHYTTDASDPTAASLKYEKPFTLRAKTVVKALALMPGRRDSGVATATFIPGPVPPNIISPDAVRLPEAEAGKPYSVEFKSDATEPVIWRLAGEIAPYVPFKSKTVVNPLGLTLDPKTGVLSGVPKGGGTFWVQVQVGGGLGRLGAVRNYLLTVRGKLLAVAQDVEDDTNVEIARLEGWPAKRVDELIAALKAAGCSPVKQEDGASVMVLVPAAEREKAQPVLAQFKLPADGVGPPAQGKKK